MSNNRRQLITLLEQNSIPQDRVVDALHITQIYPDKNGWQTFIDRFLLFFGALAIVFSLLFFMTYNWTEIGRFAKFALIEIAIVTAITVYWRFHSHQFIGKIALLSASILLGILLAYYSQTYQTGADPWQLFFYWSLLILPWTLIARFSVLWLVWLTLINISITLYNQAFPALHWFLLDATTATLWQHFIFNSLALILWQLIAAKRAWLSKPWAIRLVAIGSGVPITWLAILAILNEGDVVNVFIWLAAMLLLFYYYRNVKVDLFMLASGCFSIITVSVVLISDNYFKTSGPSLFILVAILIIIMSSVATAWLKKVHQELSS